MASKNEDEAYNLLAQASTYRVVLGRGGRVGAQWPVKTKTKPASWNSIYNNPSTGPSLNLQNPKTTLMQNVAYRPHML